MPISAALHHDLVFALTLHGLTIDDVPRDHEGLSIIDRLQRLEETGESYPHSPFKKTDLRTGHVPLWELFPQNPKTIEEQNDLLERTSELMQEERALLRKHDEPRGDINTRLNIVRNLMAYIDGEAALPDVPADDDELQEVAGLVPLLREAEALVKLRAQLVEELAEGAVPSASAVFVRQALDSETTGLRNADVRLAALRVRVATSRDYLGKVADELQPFVRLHAEMRQVQQDLEDMESALHWPGPWGEQPRLASVAHSTHL